MRVILDQPDRLYFSNPREVLTADEPDQALEALKRVEQALRAGSYVAGWFGYELGYVFERRLMPYLTPGARLLQLGVFDQPATEGPVPVGRYYVGPNSFEWSATDYSERFRIVKNLIAAGDIYQANLSFRLRFVFAGDALGLYEKLREESGAKFCGFIESADRTGDLRQIVSVSPELFFDLASDGSITARPMKGTSRRQGDDAVARAALANCKKNRAENLMIVDLIRNDLGRIAELGSVSVGDLFSVETYPTLHTMVSTITARKRSEVGFAELLKSLFPCGSVTGAPKIRAMEVLGSLESSRRGAYCGAIGHLAPDGSGQFNVAIRTLVLSERGGEMGIGGAVVQDSCESAEYAECLLKGRFLDTARRPLQLIETLRYDGSFVRLDNHLERMASSAKVFGMTFNDGRAREALKKSVSGRIGPLRCRLTLDETGAHCATASPVELNPPFWTYRISAVQISSADIFQHHKTSWRGAYDNVSGDVDEFVFLNERGELVEGSRTNIFIERHGRLLTPPVSAGALNGRLRAELLLKGVAQETILIPEDLRTGRVYFGNSLRGLIPACCVDSAP